LLFYKCAAWHTHTLASRVDTFALVLSTNLKFAYGLEFVNIKYEAKIDINKVN
jgi:hypothetical protein